jgi:hypothetical protein
MNKIAVSGFLYTDTRIRPLGLYRQSYNKSGPYLIAAIIYYALYRVSIPKLPPAQRFCVLYYL